VRFQPGHGWPSLSVLEPSGLRAGCFLHRSAGALNRPLNIEKEMLKVESGLCSLNLKIKWKALHLDLFFAQLRKNFLAQSFHGQKKVSHKCARAGFAIAGLRGNWWNWGAGMA